MLYEWRPEYYPNDFQINENTLFNGQNNLLAYYTVMRIFFKN